jgi:hypothetical protein
MAFKAGTVSWFALDSAAGSLTNLQPYIDTVDVPYDVEQLDVSALGTSAKAFIPGQTAGGQISVSGPYDVAVHSHIGSLLAAQAAGTASHSWMYGPGGSVASQAKLSGECIIASYTPPTSVGGRVEWSASLQITGAIAVATF